MDRKLRVLESDLSLGYLCKAGPPMLLSLICLIHNIPFISHKEYDCQNAFTSVSSSVRGWCEFEKALLNSLESSLFTTCWQG